MYTCKKCGLQYEKGKSCRPCRRKWEKEWAAKNPEKLREKAKKRYAKDPAGINERMKLANKEYRKNNPEKTKERDKRQYDSHADAKRESKIQYRKKNPEKVKTCHKSWREKNPEAWAKNQRIVSANRRARQKKAEGSHTVKDIRAIYDRQEGECVFCRKNLISGYEVDHIMPLCKGGSNWPDNLQLLCQICNRRKGAFTMREFILRIC